MSNHDFLYPRGVDCVWIASDAKGHIAAFVTAGVGEIPRGVLSLTGEISVEDLEAELCLLPVNTSAKMLVSVKRPDDFIDLAERGMFVYDWTDIYRTSDSYVKKYEAVASPEMPLMINNLPSRLLSIANNMNFKKIDFTIQLQLKVSDFVEVVSAYPL